MENTNKQFDILNFIKEFGPKITELNWTSEFKVPVYEFELHLKYNNIQSLGRGSSSISKEHAIEIAATEAIERMLSIILKHKNTSGISCHVNLKTAKNNASKELIERHVFLKNFYSNSFVGIKYETVFKEAWKNAGKYFSNIETTNFLIGIVPFCNQKFNVVMNVTRILKNEKCNGYIVGLGCNTDLQKASTSAEIEGLRVVSHIAKNDIRSINLEKFLSLDSPSFEEHMLLALNNDFTFVIDSKIAAKFGDVNFDPIEIDTQEISLPPDFKEIGLFFAKAYSDSVLNLFVGLPDTDFKNKYKSIYPDLYQEKNFKIPHILG